MPSVTVLAHHIRSNLISAVTRLTTVACDSSRRSSALAVTDCADAADLSAPAIAPVPYTWTTGVEADFRRDHRDEIGHIGHRTNTLGRDAARTARRNLQLIRRGRSVLKSAGLAFGVIFAFWPLTGMAAAASVGKIAVVAAENFYGDVAHQIAGDQADVTSIISNPDEDPHLFEVSPQVARRIAAAQVVIYNGADYDPWMTKLLAVSPKPGRAVIVVADLVHKKAGDNPHLWYDPPTMPAVAKALAAAFVAADSAQKEDYAARLKAFETSLEPMNKKIAEIRAKYAGVPVTASEPIFGYMAAALGLQMRNERFQIAVMNDTEPSASDVAAFENDLMEHKVRVMFYNKQASDNVVQHLIKLAQASKIPIVGVTETCPPSLSFQKWMLTELDATEGALADRK